MRLRASVLLVVAELAVALALAAAPSPACAQFFDFFGGGRRGGRPPGMMPSMPSMPFFDQPRARQHSQPRSTAGAQQGDYSRAPAPAKADKASPPDLKTIVVMGDSMADWLAYGLEQAYADTPEITVARKHRTFSSLIYNPGRHDPRTSVDWPVTAREILANEPANFAVMMIGLSDRDPIRVPAAPRPAAKVGAKPGQPDQAKPGQPDAAPGADQAKPADTPDGTAADPGVADPRAPAVTYDFKSEKWAELYGKRIDDTIAALKSKGVPVFWVGLPPILGARSTADMQYLNDQFRSRAEKAGITYIDLWDGFADDAGRFTMQGPDYEGQIRRLRTPDGVYFTPAGARKLAHYVEREIQRALTPTGLVAVPLPEEPLLQAPLATQSPQPGASTPRPLAGPVVPLNASVDTSKSDSLLGSSTPRQTIADALATRVLVKGEPTPAPAGRADDFTWPRRAPAPVGADPVVATTTLPMTPMVASSGGAQQKTATAAPGTPAATAPRVRTAQAPAHPRPRQSQYYRQQPNPFFFFFGR